MLVHKIIKVGHSFAVTLPPSLMRAMGLQHRDAVVMGLNHEGLLVIGTLSDREKLIRMGATNSPLAKAWARS